MNFARYFKIITQASFLPLGFSSSYAKHASTVGSLNDNTVVTTGNHYTQTGSADSSSKSEQSSHSETDTAVGSSVKGGGKVNITATGAGQASNIHIQGSDIAGKGGTSLTADNAITIESAQSTTLDATKNNSSGWSAGAAITIDSNGKFAAGITVGGNVGKGSGNGNSVTQRNSHVGVHFFQQGSKVAAAIFLHFLELQFVV